MGNFISNNPTRNGINNNSVNNMFENRFGTYDPILNFNFKNEIYCKNCVFYLSNNSKFETINPLNSTIKFDNCEIPKFEEIEDFNNQCAPFYHWIDNNCKLSIFDTQNFTKFVKSGNIWVMLNTHFINCIFINENFKWKDVSKKQADRLKNYIKIINLRYQEYQYLVNKYYSKSVLNSGLGFINMQNEGSIPDKINTKNKEHKKILVENESPIKSLFDNDSFLMNGKNLVTQLSFPTKMPPEGIETENS